MENRTATFAMYSEPGYMANTDEVKHNDEMYDELLRSFRRDPNDRSLIPDVTLDSADIMEYLKMRVCDLPNKKDVYLLHEFWEWLSRS